MTRFSGPALTIRPATDPDLPALRRIAAACWADIHAATLSPADLEALIGRLLREDPPLLLLPDIGERAIVADTAGGVVGFAVARLSRGEVSLLHLYVQASSRRHGVGTALVTETLRQFPTARSCRLTAPATQEAAAFYAGLGFATADQKRFTAPSGFVVLEAALPLAPGASPRPAASTTVTVPGSTGEGFHSPLPTRIVAYVQHLEERLITPPAPLRGMMKELLWIADAIASRQASPPLRLELFPACLHAASDCMADALGEDMRLLRATLFQTLFAPASASPMPHGPLDEPAQQR